MSRLMWSAQMTITLLDCLDAHVEDHASYWNEPMVQSEFVANVSKQCPGHVGPSWRQIIGKVHTLRRINELPDMAAVFRKGRAGLSDVYLQSLERKLTREQQITSTVAADDPSVSQEPQDSSSLSSTTVQGVLNPNAADDSSQSSDNQERLSPSRSNDHDEPAPSISPAVSLKEAHRKPWSSLGTGKRSNEARGSLAVSSTPGNSAQLLQTRDLGKLENYLLQDPAAYALGHKATGSLAESIYSTVFRFARDVVRDSDSTDKLGDRHVGRTISLRKALTNRDFSELCRKLLGSSDKVEICHRIAQVPVTLITFIRSLLAAGVYIWVLEGERARFERRGSECSAYSRAYEESLIEVSPELHKRVSLQATYNILTKHFDDDDLARDYALRFWEAIGLLLDENNIAYSHTRRMNHQKALNDVFRTAIQLCAATLLQRTITCHFPRYGDDFHPEQMRPESSSLEFVDSVHMTVFPAILDRDRVDNEEPLYAEIVIMQASVVPQVQHEGTSEMALD